MNAKEILKMLNEILGDSLPERLSAENVEAVIEDPLYEAEKANKFPKHSVDAGATKAVIILQGAPFVLKIPFNCRYDEEYYISRIEDVQDLHKDWDWDMCAQAVENETTIDDFLYDFEYATVHGATVEFLQENEDLLTGSDYCALETCYYKLAVEEGLSDYFAEEEYLGDLGFYPVYIQQRAMPFNAFYEIEDKSKEATARLASTRNRCKEIKCYCFDDLWVSDFFDMYGEEEFKKLDRFLHRFDIGDLRRANIGYVDGRPILFDYAGYNEW